MNHNQVKKTDFSEYLFNFATQKLVLTKQLTGLPEGFFEGFELRRSSEVDFLSRFQNLILGVITSREEKNEIIAYHTGEEMIYFHINALFSNTAIRGSIDNLSSNCYQSMEHGENERLRLIGSMASRFAHDLNNQLMVILGNCSLLRRHDMDQRAARFAENIYNASELSRTLAEELLCFSKINSIGEVFDISESINSVLILVEHIGFKHFDVIYHPPLTKMEIAGCNAMFQNAVINIIKNGVEASGDDGVITIETSNVFLSEKPDNSYTFEDFYPGEYILVSISDNGIGISEEGLENIFAPFFTTKVNHGVGLGLVNVVDTMSRFGGIITIKSRLGLGTTFSLYFKTNIDSVTSLSNIGMPKIMIIDDEPLVRTLISDILEDSGYKTVTFRGGQEAISYYACNQEDIDLVLCDFILPKMNGRQVLGKLKAINSDIKAMLLSGGKIEGEQGLENTVCLTKPIKCEELTRKVAEMLTVC